MFRVYDQDRQHNPRAGVAAAAGLLALSVLFGLAVQRQRLGADKVTLGDRLHLEGWPLSLRTPIGWERQEVNEPGIPSKIQN